MNNNNNDFSYFDIHANSPKEDWYLNEDCYYKFTNADILEFKSNLSNLSDINLLDYNNSYNDYSNEFYNSVLENDEANYVLKSQKNINTFPLNENNAFNKTEEFFDPISEFSTLDTLQKEIYEAEKENCLNSSEKSSTTSISIIDDIGESHTFNENIKNDLILGPDFNQKKIDCFISDAINLDLEFLQNNLSKQTENNIEKIYFNKSELDMDFYNRNHKEKMNLNTDYKFESFNNSQAIRMPFFSNSKTSICENTKINLKTEETNDFYKNNVTFTTPKNVSLNFACKESEYEYSEVSHLSDAVQFSRALIPPPIHNGQKRVAERPPDSDFCVSDPFMIPREQQSRFEGDEYGPRWVRGKADMKEGWCDMCPGGRWLILKNSAYWYDKNFGHGISPSTGKCHSSPLEIRLASGSDDMWEGLCDKCEKWIALSTRRDGSWTSWFRHSYKCAGKIRQN